MKISSIELAGFKSFVDRQVLRIDRPVVAIVGPNGCGKSNIVDAMRWAMGEQSVKNLRGHHMEDVIFNGSESRPPAQSAEVSLLFDNADRSAPSEYIRFEQIEVSRRLFRNGDSHYLVNKARARLKDVTDIFLGTGVGRGAYSIVEQGQVGFIVSARPEQRRQVIEEAAGVSRYRVRRREAEQKLELTAANLLRLSDRVDELGKRRRSLERQAARARRYAELNDELRTVELAFAAAAARDLDDRITRLGGQARVEDERRRGLEARLETLKARQTALAQQADEVELALQNERQRLSRIQSDQALTHQQMDYHRQETEGIRRRAEALEVERATLAGQEEKLKAELESFSALARDLSESHRERSLELGRRNQAARDATQAAKALESDINSHKERLFALSARGVDAENKARYLTAMADDITARRNRHQAESDELAREAQRATARLETLRATQEELRQRLGIQQQQVDQARQDLEEMSRHTQRAAAHRDAMQSQLASVHSALAGLKDLEDRLEGAPDGVRLAVEHRDFPRQAGRGLLAACIEAPGDLERAVAAALGEAMDFYLLADTGAGLKAADLVKGKKAGRAGFWPLDLLPQTSEETPADPPAGEDVTPLRNHLHASGPGEAAVRMLLSHVYLAPDLPRALRAWRSLTESGVRACVVCPDGGMVNRQGVILAGAPGGGGEAVLHRTRRIHDLNTQALDLAQRLETASAELSAARDAQAGAEKALKDVSARHQEDRLASLEKDKDVSIARNEQERFLQRVTVVQKEMARLDQERTGFDRRKEELAAAHADIRRQEEEGQKRLQAMQADYLARVEQLEELQGKLTEMKSDLAGSQERLNSAEAQRQRVSREADQVSHRIAALKGEQESGGSRITRLETQMEEARGRLARLHAEDAESKQSLAQLDHGLGEVKAMMGDLASQVEDLRGQLNGATGSLHAMELELTRAKGDFDHLHKDMTGRWQVDILAEARGGLKDAAPAPDAPRRIEDLRQKIDSLGPVNLLSLTEFDEVAREHDFLLTQEKDLKEAVDNLKSTIDHINRTTRHLFKESFDEINESFMRVFPRLFGGGRASLSLTEPDNLLDTGVDIIAQPPGKKTQNINLLSGGEKALTAVSLIFAIFMIKPTPFCILDEVDAPLDDANIGRVGDLIRELSATSQFLFITHNKKTMQIADILYGVTMEEPGISKLVSVDLRRTEKRP